MVSDVYFPRVNGVSTSTQTLRQALAEAGHESLLVAPDYPAKLEEAGIVRAIPNVLPEPAVEVEILEFNLVGPVLAVRPFCHTDHYWQVYFDGNRVIREALAEAGFPAPMPAQLMLTRAA